MEGFGQPNDEWMDGGKISSLLERILVVVDFHFYLVGVAGGSSGGVGVGI